MIHMSFHMYVYVIVTIFAFRVAALLAKGATTRPNSPI